MSELRSKEYELFSKWKMSRGYDSFLPDGVFDPEEWEKQPVKITYVLKEANWEGGNQDLRDWIIGESSSTYWKTWNNIARWTQAILEGGDYPRHVSNTDKTRWLRRVSFLNLKKVGGDARAESDIIRSYAQRDAAYLLEQLNLYRPDLIICCGRGDGKNADILHDFVLPICSAWQLPIQGFNYFYTQFAGKEFHTPVVSFYHPQKRASHETYQCWFESMKVIANEFRRQGVLQ